MARRKGTRPALPDWVDRGVWDQVLMAATDPQYRSAVEQFLASTRLSGELPDLLDRECLAPRRETGATGEQCANVWCNLGMSALAIPNPSFDSVEFAAGCSALVTRLGGASIEPELALRNRFLAARAGMALAMMEGDSSHAAWRSALAEVGAYLSAVGAQLGTLPAERSDAHLASAYSLALQLLEYLRPRYGLQALGAEIGDLVHSALMLADRLDPQRIARVWERSMTGMDAGSYLRLIGAEAEAHLAIDLESPDHALRGLAYVDAVLPVAQTVPPRYGGLAILLRAELLFLLERYEESMRQADALPDEADQSHLEWRHGIDARCLLRLGQPQRAAETLRPDVPTVEQALAAWDANWLGRSAEGRPLTRLRGVSPLEDSQSDWRLMAAIAAANGDTAEALRWADRSSGFLADSLLADRAAWIGKLRERQSDIAEIELTWDGKSDVWSDLTRPMRADVPPAPMPVERPAFAAIDAPLAVRAILSRLGAQTALVKILVTEEGVLTLAARLRDGEVDLEREPDMPDPRRLSSRHKAWFQFYRENLCGQDVSASVEAEGERVFAAMMEEVERLWGGLMSRLVESGITDLVFIGDDTIDTPLHAIRIGPGPTRLIERARVSYAPSLHALRVCLERPSRPPESRKGLDLRSLIDRNLESADGEATQVAATLGTQRRDLDPASADFWSELRKADILHVVAHGEHNQLLPLGSLLGTDWVNLGMGDLIADLDLPRCEIVANLACESAFPSVRRVPGLDFSTVFIAAGARSVLGSTWVVRDDVASAFCRLFFEAWASGAKSSVAFQQALDRLRRSQPALPAFDWAGLRLVGGP